MNIYEYLNQLNEELSDNIPKDIQKLYNKMVKAEMVDFEPSAYKTIKRKDWSETNSGTCWDFVNYEDEQFSKMPYNYETYYMEIDNDADCPCHTFLLYEYDGQWYWFEISWLNHQGIHEFDTKEDALKEITDLHNNEFNDGDYPLYIYKYNAKDLDDEYTPVEYINKIHSVGNEVTLTEELADNQKKFFSKFKYTKYPVYHSGSAVDDFDDETERGIWFASDSEHAKGSSDSRFGEYIIGFNNPITIDCHYYDFDEIPLDTNQLKELGLYESSFGNKYDRIMPDEVFYDDVVHSYAMSNGRMPRIEDLTRAYMEYYQMDEDEAHQCAKEFLNTDAYYVTSDELVNIGFSKGYDCVILQDINELQFHCNWSNNTDYVVKYGSQVKSLDNLNPTDSHKFTEDKIDEGFGNGERNNPTWQQIERCFIDCGLKPNRDTTFTGNLGNSYFIFPNGDIFSADCHENMTDLLEVGGLVDDYEEYCYPVVYGNCIRCCNINVYENYIELPTDRLTNEQYDRLETFLDENQKHFSNIIINLDEDFTEVIYHYDDYTTDDIIKKIKRYYSSGYLYEELQ